MKKNKLNHLNLNIQDELHLIYEFWVLCQIYETVVEELCTNRRNGNSTKPKIISNGNYKKFFKSN